MRKIIGLLLTLYCNIAQAQNQNEIALFWEPDFSYSSLSLFEHNLNGVQFRYTFGRHWAWRTSAGYGRMDYYNTPAGHLRKSHDTEYFQNTIADAKAPMPVVSAALEYRYGVGRKIELIAGAELRAGYGFGKKDTLTQWSYSDTGIFNTYVFYQPTGRSQAEVKYEVNFLSFGFDPYIGATYRWKGLSPGLEIFCLWMDTEQIYASGRNNIFSFANIGARVFVGYVF